MRPCAPIIDSSGTIRVVFILALVLELQVIEKLIIITE